MITLKDTKRNIDKDLFKKDVIVGELVETIAKLEKIDKQKDKNEYKTLDKRLKELRKEVRRIEKEEKREEKREQMSL